MFSRHFLFFMVAPLAYQVKSILLNSSSTVALCKRLTVVISPIEREKGTSSFPGNVRRMKNATSLSFLLSKCWSRWSQVSLCNKYIKGGTTKDQSIHIYLFTYTQLPTRGCGRRRQHWQGQSSGLLKWLQLWWEELPAFQLPPLQPVRHQTTCSTQTY